MTTEIFSGTPEALKARVDALVAGGATDVGVIETSEKTTYLIAYPYGAGGGGVNVNADWDAESGAAQILNKPNLGDLALLDQVDTAQIVNHAVTNQKLATMDANTVKGRLSGNGTAQDVAMSSLPISTATQTALNLKLEASDIANKVSSDPSGVTGADQVTNMMSLTQAEYDAIVTPDASTFYLITDAV